MKYRCLDCGYIYDEKVEEISFMKLEAKWACPECNAPKSEFEIAEGYEEEIELEDEDPIIKTEEDSKYEY
jgi:rubredoxin